MSYTTENARQNGQRDAQQGNGPQNTNGWSADNRKAYDAAYNQNKK